MDKPLSFKKRMILAIAPRVLGLWLRFVFWTSKVHKVGFEQLGELQAREESWIFCLWHQKIAISSRFLGRFRPIGMISESYDGAVIAGVLESMGFSSARGSSSKGGAKALMKMIKAIRKGQVGAITPDGPRGPYHSFEPGTLALAQKTGAPLIPWDLEASPVKIFEKSWDRHYLPKPFGRILIRLGEPLYVDPELKGEALQAKAEEVKEAMRENQRLCQAELNHHLGTE